MWDKIIELAISDGIWTLLFCVLLIYELKDSRTREKKYQETITSLSQDLGYLKDLDEEVAEVNGAVRKYMENSAREESLCQDKVNCAAKEVV